MANPPVSFTPYLGWVDVSDPNNIPAGTQKINAANLLRLERGVDAAVKRANLLTLFSDAVQVAVGGDWTVRTFPTTTALRPSASTLGAGATIFDTDLSKPLWSTGSVWVDSTGAQA